MPAPKIQNRDEANESDSSESCLTPEWEGSSFVERDISEVWDD